MVPDLDDPAARWSDGAVTPSDSEVIHPLPSGFVVLTTGNVVIQDAGGNELTFTAVEASPDIYPYRVYKLMAATTAVVALVYPL